MEERKRWKSSEIVIIPSWMKPCGFATEKDVGMRETKLKEREGLESIEAVMAELATGFCVVSCWEPFPV